MRAVLLAIVLAACPTTPWAADSGCSQAGPQKLRVRFSGEAARDVLLESQQPSGFRLRDAASGEPLLSVGPGASNTQQIAAMTSAFGASFTAVHLDADGLHDRIYAGDRAGRLWRLDLHAGARRSDWMQSWILADLGTPGGGRGFIARPDVTRIDTNGGSWLNIAIGTANTAAPRNDHRFFVLRDTLATPADAPLHETDLEALSPPAGVGAGNTHGYYLVLGSAQVLAQALTMEGRIHFVTVETPRNLIAACAPDALPDDHAPLSVTVLRARDGTVATDTQRDGASRPVLRRPLGTALPASTGVQLSAGSSASAGLVACTIGDERLDGCALDTRPRRSWWRREDAD